MIISFVTVGLLKDRNKPGQSHYHNTMIEIILKMLLQMTPTMIGILRIDNSRDYQVD